MSSPLPHPRPSLYPFDTKLEDIVTRAAAPLARDRRDLFMQEVSEVVRATNASGEGEIFRICREIQRKHFDPPLDPAGPKYSRRMK